MRDLLTECRKSLEDCKVLISDIMTQQVKLARIQEEVELLLENPDPITKEHETLISEEVLKQREYSECQLAKAKILVEKYESLIRGLETK